MFCNCPLEQQPATSKLETMRRPFAMRWRENGTFALPCRDERGERK
jgi:hypothetical protein